MASSSEEPSSSSSEVEPRISTITMDGRIRSCVNLGRAAKVGETVSFNLTNAPESVLLGKIKAITQTRAGYPVDYEIEWLDEPPFEPITCQIVSVDCPPECCPEAMEFDAGTRTLTITLNTGETISATVPCFS